jgi:GNAT superfamily N-acetyltransferase
MPDDPPLAIAPLPDLRAIELTPADAPALQRFFDANPGYFIAVTGAPAGPDEARDEIGQGLPPGWTFTRKWLIGYVDANDEVAAMASVVADLLVRDVWHIGLVIVATSRHGTGDAHRLYEGLESWMRARGARWLRLGVVSGNARAERFWTRVGYVETRTREGVAMGRRVNTIRVMVKTLADEPLERYLALVERDRPDPPPAASSATGS